MRCISRKSADLPHNSRNRAGTCPPCHFGEGEKMIRYCTECGQPFKCSPSNKTVTCGKPCSKTRRSRLLTGHTVSQQTRQKIAVKASSQIRPALHSGTAAAQRSPKAGRFETNSSAKSWTLISPSGMQYKCTNLNMFIRCHSDLFGIRADDDAAVSRIAHCFIELKKGLKNGTRSTCCKGWRMVFMSGDGIKNCKK